MKPKAGEQGQVQAIFEQGDQLSHWLENWPEDEDVFRQAEGNRIHHTDKEQEDHFAQRHGVANMIKGIQKGAKQNRRNQPKGFFQPQQHPTSPEYGFEKSDAERERQQGYEIFELWEVATSERTRIL